MTVFSVKNANSVIQRLIHIVVLHHQYDFVRMLMIPANMSEAIPVAFEI